MRAAGQACAVVDGVRVRAGGLCALRQSHAGTPDRLRVPATEGGEVSEETRDVIVAIAACVLAFIGGMAVGSDAGISYQKRQAVKAGAAVWSADPEGPVRIEYLKREAK